jgi:hypothetical protein
MEDNDMLATEANMTPKKMFLLHTTMICMKSSRDLPMDEQSRTDHQSPKKFRVGNLTDISGEIMPYITNMYC